MLFLFDTIREMLFFFNEVSIYLLLGFFVAGIIHTVFSESIIQRHLGNNTFGSVIKATLFGIPLPLCSCAVVPVAASLKNSGASKGSGISFLISTPQVGADSFLITYSLLGWVFGIFRIAASIVTALAAGILVNLINGNDKKQTHNPAINTNGSETFKIRVKSFFSYIEYNLLGSIANTLVIGIIIAGIITAVIPDGFFTMYHLDNSLLSMSMMLAISIPMYVCAAASTPIAASLIMKGISPGAALVFLLSGPATNAITISTVINVFGKKAASIYLSSIVIVSLSMGYLLDLIIGEYGFTNIIPLHEHEILPQYLKIGASILLTAMLGWYYYKNKMISKSAEEVTMDNKTTLKISGMTCMHCAESVKKAVESVKYVSNISVNLKKKTVVFNMEKGDALEKVKVAIKLAGFNT